MLTVGLRLVWDIYFNLYLRVSVCKIQNGAIYEIQSSKIYFIKSNEILIRIDSKIVKSNLVAIFCYFSCKLDCLQFSVIFLGIFGNFVIDFVCLKLKYLKSKKDNIKP